MSDMRGAVDLSRYMPRDEHSTLAAHRMGLVIPYGSTPLECMPGILGNVGEGEVPAAWDHTHNVKMLVSSAVPADVDNTLTVEPGIFYFHTTTGRFYIKAGSNVWIYYSSSGSVLV